MQQPAPTPGLPPGTYSDLQIALNPIVRQLERLEDRLQRDMEALRHDMDDLRRELVTKDALVPQIAALENRLKSLEEERVSRVERFWMRVGPIVAMIAIIVPLIEAFTHFRVVP